MTIDDFAKRTGISKSALRYYESKQLFHAKRNKNGYRMYAEDQVPIIKLISSLRLAGVSIRDIQTFLHEKNEQLKHDMLNDWIVSIKERLEVLNVSWRYLESYSSAEEVYLIEKAEENIIWFTAEDEVGKFKRRFIEKGKYLVDLNIPIKGCYFRYLSGDGVIKGKIGFGVPFDLPSNLPNDCTVEHMTFSLCIALPYNGPYTDIPKGYSQLLTYANEHQWIPSGPVLEWYRGNDFNTLDLLMPVTHVGKKGGTTHE